MGRARVGDDAAADPGRPGRAPLPRLPRALPDGPVLRRRPGRRGPALVERARLQQPGAPPARRGEGRGGRARRPLPVDAGGAAAVAGHRSVHGAGRAGLRLRGRCRRGRHQRRSHAGPVARPPAALGRGPGAGRWRAAGRPGLGVEPVAPRSGRHRVHGRVPALRSVPAGPRLLLAAGGVGPPPTRPRARPTRGAARAGSRARTVRAAAGSCGPSPPVELRAASSRPAWPA